MPACLVKMLLIMSGIETNPGPPGPQGKVYVCCVCQKTLSQNSCSVKCNKCENWCHFRKKKETNCSQLKSTSHYTDRFICKPCTLLPTTPEYIKQTNQSQNLTTKLQWTQRENKRNYRMDESRKC